MEGVPSWILDSFSDNAFECPHCGDDFYKEGIDAVSIRKAYKDTGKIVLSIEYKCVRCQKSAMIELREITFELFIQNCLDVKGDGSDSGAITKYNQKEAQNISEFDEKKNNMEKEEENQEEEYSREKPPKAKKRHKSKISNKETLSAKKILKESKTHKEWLDAIGAGGYIFDISGKKKNSKMENTFKVIGMDQVPIKENNDKDK